MAMAHESLLKHKELIAKTFNRIQIDELSKYDLSISSQKVQNLNKDSQLCIDTLAQQEKISETFVFNSFKLYNMLNRYEKKLKRDAEQISKK